jgi:hypothetical protein
VQIVSSLPHTAIAPHTQHAPLVLPQRNLLRQLTWGLPSGQALARRMIREGGSRPADRAARGFRLVLSRQPAAAEIDRLVRLHDDARAEYAAAPDDAEKMATDPLGPPPADLQADMADLAAWTVVANVILNLDETFMCP